METIDLLNSSVEDDDSEEEREIETQKITPNEISAAKTLKKEEPGHADKVKTDVEPIKKEEDFDKKLLSWI